MTEEMKAIQAFIGSLEVNGFEPIEESAIVPFEGLGAGNDKGCNGSCANSKNELDCTNVQTCTDASNMSGCSNPGACNGANNSSLCTGGGSGGGTGGGSNAIGFPASIF